jgi:hypothetical protein
MTQQQTQQKGTNVPSQALPSDGMSRFVRAGAWAAMVGGMAVVVSVLLAWLVVPYERLGLTDAYLTTSYSVSSGLRLLGLILFLWGLIGIYGPQSRAAGTFGLWTFVVAFLCTALAVGNVWAEVFVYPTLVQVAPDMLSGASSGTEAAYFSTGLSMSYPLFFLGLILFAASTFWARVYPRWIALLLIISVPVTMFLDPTPGTFQESIGPALWGFVFAAYGFYALSREPSTTSSS